MQLGFAVRMNGELHKYAQNVVPQCLTYPIFSVLGALSQSRCLGALSWSIDSEPTLFSAFSVLFAERCLLSCLGQECSVNPHHADAHETSCNVRTMVGGRHCDSLAPALQYVQLSAALSTAFPRKCQINSTAQSSLSQVWVIQPHPWASVESSQLMGQASARQEGVRPCRKPPRRPKQCTRGRVRYG